jgi:hypothetical protein
MTILTHTVSSVAVSLLLILFWVSNIIYKKWYNEGDKKPLPRAPLVNLILIILFNSAMTGYWMYISGDLIYIANAIKSALILKYLISPGPVLQYRYAIYDEFF